MFNRNPAGRSSSLYELVCTEEAAPVDPFVSDANQQAGDTATSDAYFPYLSNKLPVTTDSMPASSGPSADSSTRRSLRRTMAAPPTPVTSPPGPDTPESPVILPANCAVARPRSPRGAN